MTKIASVPRSNAHFIDDPLCVARLDHEYLIRAVTQDFRHYRRMPKILPESHVTQLGQCTLAPLTILTVVPNQDKECWNRTCWIRL